jgi:hypothetical protein
MSKDWFFLQNIDRAGFGFGKSFFLDTNVWLFINGPFADFQDRRTALYSRMLKKILDNKGTITFDLTVVSEFYNRFLKIIKDAHAPEMTLKQFRATQDFLGHADFAKRSIKGMLARHKFTSIALTSNDIARVVDQFDVCARDIGDEMIKEVCRREGHLLVTDDADYVGTNVAVVSCNGKYAPAT